MTGWASRARVLVFGVLVASAAGARDVEFLHIEANAGSSAGGHTAIRIGDRVFDFQNHQHGTLRLRRGDPDDFRHIYSVLDNRSIRVARLDVTPETANRILSRFNHRYLVQNKHFAVQGSLARDVALLERLLDAGGGDHWDVSGVSGAGFFEPGTRDSTTLKVLRSRIDSIHGEGFVAERLDSLERDAGALTPENGHEPITPIDADRVSSIPASFSDRYLELATGILAYRALLEGRSLRSESLHAGGTEGQHLDPKQLRGLRNYRERLLADLTALAASNRPDRGEALLLGMARLETIDRSIASRHLVVLDAFPSDAYVIAERAVKQRRLFLGELEALHRKELDLAWSQLAGADDPIEPDFAWVETATNRHRDLLLGLRDEHEIRIHGERIQPRAIATGRDLPRPRLARSALRAAHAEAIARRAAHEERLRETFGYDLLRHNCATELFATLNAEFGPEESERALGGRIAPGDDLNYIPIVAFDAVIDHYRIAEVGVIPSYRRTRIEADVARSNPVFVGLRESTTLTSAFYRDNPHDSFFVFFTQDAPVLRPVLGAVNLVAAAGEFTLGLFRAPFDRGDMAWSGVKGFASSLPELLFVNLRKGHMEYGPGDVPHTSYRRLGD